MHKLGCILDTPFMCGWAHFADKVTIVATSTGQHLKFYATAYYSLIWLDCVLANMMTWY